MPIYIEGNFRATEDLRCLVFVPWKFHTALRRYHVRATAPGETGRGQAHSEDDMGKQWYSRPARPHTEGRLAHKHGMKQKSLWSFRPKDLMLIYLNGRRSSMQNQSLFKFPKARIPRSWFRQFNDNKQFHNEGTLQLFSLMALYSYANYRSDKKTVAAGKKKIVSKPGKKLASKKKPHSNAWFFMMTLSLPSISSPPYRKSSSLIQ